ncbi:MAG: hypothetical protein K6E53_11730, partial [Lachnospiraceae bacterium]|nr:hypothetical protein [Lachnospiraceae bacterium]
MTRPNVTTNKNNSKKGKGKRNMERNLSDVHYDMILLGSEIEGLKSMLYTISMSVENLNLNESTEEELDRIAAPYPAIISFLDTIIMKLDRYTDEIDGIDLHMRKSIDLPGTA